MVQMEGGWMRLCAWEDITGIQGTDTIRWENGPSRQYKQNREHMNLTPKDVGADTWNARAGCGDTRLARPRTWQQTCARGSHCSGMPRVSSRVGVSPS